MSKDPNVSEHDGNDDDLDTTLDNDSESPEGDAGTGDDDAEGDEYTPPTHDEWKRTQSALKKANDQARKWRQKARELEKGKEGAGEEAGREAADKYRPILVKKAAQAALLSAGVESAKVARALKLIDLAELDVDDEGEVDGLDAEVDSLKDEWPELFEAKQEKRQRVPRVNGSNRTSSAPQARSSAAKLSDLLAR
jgi:hypothetical protein